MDNRKRMYGLLQASILANNLLKEQLAHHGYLSNLTHREYGNMSLAWCGSTYVWTILVFSILEENIFNIYMMHYKKKHMKL
jgi:hypothetical protein